MNPSPNPVIPARFRRAARRARLWRWFWRLGVALLLVAGLASLALFLALPKLARQRARQELGAVGLEADLEVSRLSHRGLTIRNFSLGQQPGALRIARLEVDFSLAELRSGLIREVRLSGVEGVVGRPGAEWTFAGLERFRPAAASPAGQPSLTVRSLSIVDSLATLELPNLPPLHVPFSAKAEAVPAGGYQFRATLAPEQSPVIVGGEFNPDLGSGRLEATARGVQARDWSPFIVLAQHLPYTLEQADGSADLVVAAIVDHYALVWGRLDIELAGLSLAGRERQPNGSRRWQATVLGANLTVDLVPAPEGTAKPPVKATLAAKQIQVASTLEDQSTTLRLARLDGIVGVAWDSQGRPHYDLGATLHGLHLDHPLFVTTADQAELDCPPFLTRDGFRWQLGAVGWRLQAADFKMGPGAATASGTLADLELAMTACPFQWRGTLQGSVGSTIVIAGLPATPKATGKVVLHSLADLKQLYLDQPVAGSFVADHQQTTLTIPRLDTPILPDLALGEIVATLDYSSGKLAATVDATAKLPLATLGTFAGVSETGGTVLAAKLTGSAKLDGDQLDFQARATLPRQPLAVTLDELRLTTTAQATLELTGPSRPSLAVDASLEKVEAHCGATRWTADKLGLRKGEVAPLDAKAAERLLRLELATWAQDLRLAGKLLATGLAGQVGPLAIKGGQFDLPLAWHGEKGFLTDDQAPNPLSLQIGQLQFGKLIFHPGPFVGQANGREMRWSGPFRDPGAALAGTVDATFTLGAGLAGLLRTTVAVDNLAALTWLPALLPVPFDQAQISGQATGAASLFIDPVSLSGTAEARLAGVDVVLPSDGLAIRGLEVNLRFRELQPPATPPRQLIVFRELAVGKLQFGPGRIDLQLPGDGRVFVESGQIGWCDGLLKTHALMLDPAANRLDLEIVADNLDLALLLRRQDFVVGDGQGRLSGRLPFTLQAGRVTFGDCFLYAAPGSKGALKLSDATGLANLVPDRNESKQLMQQIVADMEYTLLKIDLQGLGQPPELRISLDGASQANRKLPPLRLRAKLQFDNNDVNDMIMTLRKLKSMTGGK